MHKPLVIGLPTADRPTSHRFYTEGLGFSAFGEPADDGVPEPLQFALDDGVHLMLIPPGGFGWVIGGRTVAPAGTSECLLSIAAATEAEVHEVIDRAVAAGAELVTEAGQQPWGYAGAFADPDGHVWMVVAGPFAS